MNPDESKPMIKKRYKNVSSKPSKSLIQDTFNVNESVTNLRISSVQRNEFQLIEGVNTTFPTRSELIQTLSPTRKIGNITARLHTKQMSFKKFKELPPIDINSIESIDFKV